MNIFSEAIVEQYKGCKHDLPWRGSSDPYRVWISEIILQQTRVAQEYGYFLRFIGRFPNVKALTDADEDKVIKYWQGLGHHSRVRSLHAAAKSMSGVSLEIYPGVLMLEGVGKYTAAAICSFAYGMSYVVTDGNVCWILPRYFGIDIPIDSTEGEELLAALADEVPDKKQPTLYNQDIMDFGAIQYTPRSFDYLLRPLTDNCSALSTGRVTQLPVRQHKTETTNRYFNHIYVCAGVHTYIDRRMASDMRKSLFELPLIETSVALSEEELPALPKSRSLTASDEDPVMRSVYRGVKHMLSHWVIYTNPYEVALPEDTKSPANSQRVRLGELDRCAIFKLVQTLTRVVSNR